MAINVKAYANADDVLIAWQPDTWSNDWVGFQLERRNNTTQQSTVLFNRIPPKPGEKPLPNGAIASTQSPFRRCIWTDHSVVDTDDVSYRVTAMKAGPNDTFTPDAPTTTDWTAPLVATGDAGGGLRREPFLNVALGRSGCLGERRGIHWSLLRESLVESELVSQQHQRGVHRRADIANHLSHE